MKKGGFTFDWPLYGNKQITEFLERLIDKDNVSGTFIFNGPDNLGKTTSARYFAQSLLCENYRKKNGPLPCFVCPSCLQFKMLSNSSAEKSGDDDCRHGDFHYIKKAKDKKNITVEQVREFIKTLSLTSFLGRFKIGIIKHADHLSEEAANALLKTLEEPRPNVVIILISTQLESLPATIASRSQILTFNPVPAGTIYDYLISGHQAQRSQAKNFSRLCLGRPALAIKFLENRDFFDKYTAHMRFFLDFFRQDINERFLSIAEMLAEKGSGQELVAQVRRVLEIWQGVVRDWLLLEYGLDNLIQHEVAETELKSIKKTISASDALRLEKILHRAGEYLDSNVNPKTVLETIAISI